MPNTDRECVNCGFEGSYLDFYRRPKVRVRDYRQEPEQQRCEQLNAGDEICGGRVRFIADGDEAEGDAEALDKIAALLHGREWDAEDIERVAELVRQSGRTIGPPAEEPHVILVTPFQD